MVNVLYSIPAPYSENTVQVYGDPEMGWYEWRIVSDAGKVIKDSRNLGAGSPGVAMRYALNYLNEEV